MKRRLFLLIILYSVLSACSKERVVNPEREIRSISLNYSDVEDSRYSLYTFAYDTLGRVDRLAYTGLLYVYGETMIRADYTYTVDYNGTSPVVTMRVENPVIVLESGTYPYEGLPEEEVLPLTFDAAGRITAIAGRVLWFHLDEMTFEYDTAGRLVRITESDGAYYYTEIDWTWTNGNLAAQTHRTAAYTTPRSFTRSGRANDYSVDLNWLAGGLGLGPQNALTPLALLGLLGTRSDRLIGATTEWDDSRSEISYTLSNDAITGFTFQVLGSSYSYGVNY